MKTTVNNRRSNLKVLEEFILRNRITVTGENCYSVAKGFNYHIVKLHNPTLSRTCSKFQKRLKHSMQRSLRVMQLYCHCNSIDNNLGYVYIISNPAFPGWFKIGSAKDAEKRLINYQTSSPLRDYKLENYYMTDNYREEERRILSLFPDRNNEWVYRPLEDIIACMA